MSLSFIDGRYVRNLTEDTSQGGAKYENGDYTRAVVVGNNVQSGVTQNGALDGVPIEFVLERINSQNIPVINVLDSYTAARAIASLRARGTDAHLWLPGGDVRTYGPELVTGNSSTFDSGTGNVRQNLYSTIAAVGGVLRVTQTAINGRAALTVPCTIGRTYSLSISLRSVSGAAAASAGFSVYDDGNTATYTSNASTTFQTITATKTATEANLYVSLGANGDGSSVFEYDNISVREITSITPTITSGLTTGNYLESTGNTLATVDNPTGLVLDALGSVGVELVANGDNEVGLFAFGAMSVFNTTAARVAGVGGRSGFVAQVNSSSSSSVAHQYNAGTACQAGKSYLISVDVYVPTGGVAAFRFFDNNDGSYFSQSVTIKDAWVTVSETRVAKATDWYIGFGNNINDVVVNGAPAFYLDNISVREVTGIHLTQTTTANKPVLRRGLTNLLTYSSDLSNAVWTVVNSATKTATTCTFAANDSSTVHNLCVVSGGTASKTFTAAVKVSCASGTVPFRIKNTHSAVLDNFSGEMLATTTPTIFVFTVTNSGSAGNGVQTIGLINSAVTPVVNTLTVDGVSLFQGTLTAAQILAAGGIPATTTAAASNPDAGKYSWSFDGSNDSLALGSVPFQMGDDWAVVCAAKHGTPASWSTIFSIAGASANPRIKLYLDNTGGIFGAYLRGDSGQFVNPMGATNYKNTSAVVTLCKRGNNVYLRVNKVQVAASSTATIGTATFTASAIGTDAFGGDIFVGDMYFISAAKGTFQDADLALEESLAASAAGITI